MIGILVAGMIRKRTDKCAIMSYSASGSDNKELENKHQQKERSENIVIEKTICTLELELEYVPTANFYVR